MTPPMTITMRGLIEAAERDLRTLKRTAERAREASKAAPDDRELRHAADDAGDLVAAAGRDLVALRFEDDLDRWTDRVQAGDVIPDADLVALAPRVRRAPDWSWVGAASLRRDGVTVPQGWRSPESGELCHASPDPNRPRTDPR